MAREAWCVIPRALLEAGGQLGAGLLAEDCGVIVVHPAEVVRCTETEKGWMVSVAVPNNPTNEGNR